MEENKRHLIFQLKFSGGSFLGLALLFVVFMVMDARLLSDGVAVWLKPLRFALAFGFHSFSLYFFLLVLKRVEVSDECFYRATSIQIPVLWIELICISVQGARGVFSHFNISTPFDHLVLWVMAIGTALLMISTLLILVGLYKAPHPIRFVNVAAGVGVLLSFFGQLVGASMTFPTFLQKQALLSGVKLAFVGSRTTENIFPFQARSQIPFFGWDLLAGDLRFPHFIGLHGFQFGILISFLLQRRIYQSRPGNYLSVVALIGYGSIFTLSYFYSRHFIKLEPYLVSWAGFLVSIIIVSIFGLSYRGNERFSECHNAKD